MKNLLALLVVAGVFLFFAFQDEGDNFIKALFDPESERNPANIVQNAEDVTADYGNATQRRIEAEFGE